MSVGVAISTVGNRPLMLECAVRDWQNALMPLVTVQNDDQRRGVAWNKNRGIADLMDAGVEHLFLADDDMAPLFHSSWTRYVEHDLPHLMLCWGKHRRLDPATQPGGLTYWKWPRGVLLYAHRSVVERVGGMRTEFGAGGHEHVEWSRRVHQAGFTPYPFIDLEQNPEGWFYAEDMPRPRETANQFQSRKRRHTTIRRTFADKRRIAELWDSLDGNTDYVDYRTEQP